MKALQGLKTLGNLILGYETATNPEKRLDFLDFFFYFFLIAIIISFCVYIIKGIKKKKQEYYQKEFTSKERYASKKNSEEFEEKLRQSRQAAEAMEGEVSLHINPKKSEPKKHNTGEYIDFENIDDK